MITIHLQRSTELSYIKQIIHLNIDYVSINNKMFI